MLEEVSLYSNVILCGQGADLVLTDGSFSASTNSKRPALWQDVKNKRCTTRGTSAAEVRN
jgi:hypothetical protein